MSVSPQLQPQPPSRTPMQRARRSNRMWSIVLVGLFLTLIGLIIFMLIPKQDSSEPEMPEPEMPAPATYAPAPPATYAPAPPATYAPAPPATYAPAPPATYAPSAPMDPYSSLGCYHDTDDRALRNTAPTEDHTIESCYNYAKSNNSKIFGMQYGNQCWIDSDPNRDYAMHGVATCITRSGFPTGSGSDFLNEIYQIN
jgi:hypothetical protein